MSIIPAKHQYSFASVCISRYILVKLLTWLQTLCLFVSLYVVILTVTPVRHFCASNNEFKPQV